jgi:hypothetical protein
MAESTTKMLKSKRIKTILINTSSDVSTPSLNADLAAALASAQPRASVNTIDTDRLVALAKLAETELYLLDLAPSSRTGATYTHHAGGPSANAYKYRQGCTQVQLVRKTDGWHLLQASRVSVYPKQSALNNLTLTQIQAARALAKFKSSFSVKTA